MTINANTRDKRTSHPSRIDFDVEEFEKLIEDQGVYVRITPSVLCPNRTGEDNTNHKLDCQVCNGDEAVDLTSQTVEDYAFIQGIDLKHDYSKLGIFNIKDAQMSIRGSIKIWYYYKIEILDHTSLYNEVVTRSGNSDKLRYNAITTASDGRLFIIDSDSIEYSLTTDFTISGQNITWVAGKGPQEGGLYSIQYPVLPTFRVMELLHENRYYYESSNRPTKIPVNLPQQCILRYDYLSKNKGANEEINT